MRWLNTRVDHTGFAPCLQAIALFKAGTPLTHEQNVQVVAELPIYFVTERLISTPGEDLRRQDTGQGAICPETRHEIFTHIGNRTGILTLAQKIVNQVAQAVAAGAGFPPPPPVRRAPARSREDNPHLLRARPGLDRYFLPPNHPRHRART